MTGYNKLSVRFCRRNLLEEGSSVVRDRFARDYSDLIETDAYHCLGHCTLCHQGPFCTVNDFLFQEKHSAALEVRLQHIFNQLRCRLQEKLKQQDNESATEG